MIEYGYINENGYLVSKILKEYVEKYKDEETGETKERMVTIEEQSAFLSKNGWKIVDMVDASRLECEENYSIHIQPCDAGDRIGYRYEKSLDKNAVKKKIDALTYRLSSETSDIGDYRIIKCYEASLLGKPLPYDIEELSIKRQEVREEINKLKKMLEEDIF